MSSKVNELNTGTLQARIHATDAAVYSRPITLIMDRCGEAVYLLCLSTRKFLRAYHVFTLHNSQATIVISSLRTFRGSQMEIAKCQEREPAIDEKKEGALERCMK